MLIYIVVVKAVLVGVYSWSLLNCEFLWTTCIIIWLTIDIIYLHQYTNLYTCLYVYTYICIIWTMRLLRSYSIFKLMWNKDKHYFDTCLLQNNKMFIYKLTKCPRDKTYLLLAIELFYLHWIELLAILSR